jgi:hypothetical protein
MNRLLPCILPLFLLIGCDYDKVKDRQILELQQTQAADQIMITELTKTVEDLKTQLDGSKQQQTELQKQFEDKQKAADQRVKEYQDTLDKLKQEFDDYRAKYRVSIRKKIVGEEYTTLITLSGKTYNQVKITKADAAYLYFIHGTGVVKVSFTDLPKTWTDRMDYDSEEAAQLIFQEQKSQRLAEDQKYANDALIRKAENKAMAEQGALSNERRKSELTSQLQQKYNNLEGLLRVIITRYKVPPKSRPVMDSNGNTRMEAYYDYSENSWVLGVNGIDSTVLEAKTVAQDIRVIKSKLNP